MIAQQQRAAAALALQKQQQPQIIQTQPMNMVKNRGRPANITKTSPIGMMRPNQGMPQMPPGGFIMPNNFNMNNAAAAQLIQVSVPIKTPFIFDDHFRSMEIFFSRSKHFSNSKKDRHALMIYF